MKYNLLIYPISYKKNYPHPYSNGSIKRGKKGKCFLSVPVIHDPSNLPQVSSSYPIHTSLLSEDHSRILRPPNNRQAQGHYVTGEQCIHIQANMITHCLKNNYIKLLIHYTLKTLLLSTQACCRDNPRILRPPNNRQAQGHYATGEQCIHIQANMITHCLRNNYIKLLIHYTLKTSLRRFPYGCNLNILICTFIVA